MPLQFIRHHLRQPHKVAVAKNIAWMLSERAAQICVAIVVNALMARRLGPAQFGLLQYALSLTAVAGSVALCCGAEVVVPRLAQHPDQHRPILGAAFMLRISAAALAYLCLVVIAYLAADPSAKTLLLVFGITVLLREPFGVATAWMQARTYNRPGVLIGLAGLCARLLIVAVLYLAAINSPVPYAAASVVDALIAAVLLGGYCLSRGAVTFSLRALKPVIQTLARQGTAIWMGLVCMALFLQVDRILLKRFVSLAQLGFYASAMHITVAFAALAPLFVNSFAPAFVYQIQDSARAWRNTRRILMLTTATGLGGAALIALLADFIIPLIFGNRFVAAAPVLRLAIFASVLAFVDAALNLMLLRQRAAWWIACKWLAAVLAALIMDVCLIPVLGIQGAVAGYAGGYLVAIGVTLLSIRSVTSSLAAEPDHRHL